MQRPAPHVQAKRAERDLLAVIGSIQHEIRGIWIGTKELPHYGIIVG
jgi:hypothetical protein